MSMSLLKRFPLTRPCWLALLTLISFAAHIQAEVVTIPDANLRAAITSKLGKSPGDPITEDEMAGMSELIAPSRGISNLTGLDYAINVTSLDFRNNQITDISPLKNLTNLTFLQLDENQISNLSPLRGLSALSQVYLSNNKIEDISHLQGLALGVLHITRNNIDISDGSGDRTLVIDPLKEAGAEVLYSPQIKPLIQPRDLALAFTSSPGDSLVFPFRISNYGSFELSWSISTSDCWISVTPNSGKLIPYESATVHLSIDSIPDYTDQLTSSFVIHSNDRDSPDIIVPINIFPPNLPAITIPDANLRAVIERKLYKEPGDPITAADMSKITVLDAYGENVSSLEGLEYATSLRRLYLAFNQISNVSPLGGLSQLEVLELWLNQIEDISPLVGLTNLEVLKLNRNQIKDISPLNGLTNLRELPLAENQIIDISPLNNLTLLEELVLSHNQIDAIPDLGKLTNIRKVLLDDNQISDISGLRSLPEVGELYLQANQIKDISALSGLSKLGYLIISYNQIEDITPLEGISLSMFNFSYNFIDISPGSEARVKVIDPLLVNGWPVDSYSPQFEPQIDVSTKKHVLPGSPGGSIQSSIELKNEGNYALTWSVHSSSPWISFDTDSGSISPDNESTIRFSIDPIPEYAGSLTGTITILSDDHENPSIEIPIEILTAIEIPDPTLRSTLRSHFENEERDFVTDSDMASLTQFGITGKNLTDLTGLEYATNLTKLDFSRNKIEDISPLSNLKSLKELDLRSNQIKDLSPLKDLTSLTYLYLTDNQIEDISFLSGLTGLKKLALMDNSISDLSALSGMTSLASLQLSNNKIDNITSLNNLKSLDYLDLGSNQIKDISPLGGTTNLNHLLLNSNEIEDISALSSLNLLWILNLSSNNITNVFPLSGLTNIEGLHLTGNIINDASPLSSLTNLKSLYLSYNRIIDVSPMVELNLSVLLISNNFIDISDDSFSRTMVFTPLLRSGAIVRFEPQFHPTQDFEYFTSYYAIPPGQDNFLDKNGPLEIPNLMAFAMGIDPMSATPDMLPMAVRDEETGACSFCFHRNLATMDVELLIEASEDLETWEPVPPEELTILSDEGDGQQYVEAAFGEEGQHRFLRLRAVPTGQ